jgi:hypothetical protein
MFITACFGAATGDLAVPAKSHPTATPSRLDYMVLASMADSQHALSMASYRPSP